MDGVRRRLRELLGARGMRGDRLEAVLDAVERSGDLPPTDPVEALAAGIDLGSRLARAGAGAGGAEAPGLNGGLRRFEAQVAELQSVLRRVAEQLERRRRDRDGPPSSRTLH